MNKTDCIKKKVKKKNKRRIILLIILVFFVLCLFYYFKVVCPIIVSLSEEKIRSLATSSISKVVGKVMSNENLSYSDLVITTYSQENKVELIEVNTVKVNKIIREITEGVQEDFNSLSKQGINIAIGTFSGIPFLYGIGPDVPIKLVPIGTVNTKVLSNFESAGINQTLHRLYFTVSANIGMVMPAKTQSFNTELEVLLCESVIVGVIPDVYLHNLV